MKSDSLPLVSIIVPLYNQERYLRACLRSVCRQTYKNLEIILVDDGSLDERGKICDNIARQDRRIKFVHKKKG